VSETVNVAAGVQYCGAPTLDGGICRQIVTSKGSGLCIHHDPARAQEATEARRRGALVANSREPQPDDVPPPPAPKSLQDVCDWLSWVTGALARGQVDKATGTGCTYALQQLRQSLVSRDFEQEVEQLRATVASL
jgi:hypothetical protein